MRRQLDQWSRKRKANTSMAIGSSTSRSISRRFGFEHLERRDLLTTVTIQANDPDAGEPSAAGQFTISRSYADYYAQTVYYEITGTATNGIDFQSLGSPVSGVIRGSVTIPSYATSATINVTPVDDSSDEGSETVQLTIVPNPNSSCCCGGGGYTIGSPSSATVTITDDDGDPEVSVAATTPNTTEVGSAARFTLTRSDTDTAITVSYSLGGTATAGTDYTSLTGTVSFAVGVAEAFVDISPIDDSTFEFHETVQLTVSSGTGYTVGTPSSAQVTINDNDGWDVTVTASDATAAEQETTTGQFTVTRAGTASLSDPLTVYYTVGGTATSSSDYQSLSGTVVIPAFENSATIAVNPLNDTAVDADETITVLLTPQSGTGGYRVASPSSAEVTILDNDFTGATPTTERIFVTSQVLLDTEGVINAGLVDDPDGELRTVSFYYDSDDDGVIESTDQLLGTDEESSDGWSISFDSTGMSVGEGSVAVVIGSLDDWDVEIIPEEIIIVDRNSAQPIFLRQQDDAWMLFDTNSQTYGRIQGYSFPTVVDDQAMFNDTGSALGGAIGSLTRVDLSKEGASLLSLGSITASGAVAPGNTMNAGFDALHMSQTILQMNSAMTAWADGDLSVAAAVQSGPSTDRHSYIIGSTTDGNGSTRAIGTPVDVDGILTVGWLMTNTHHFQILTEVKVYQNNVLIFAASVDVDGSFVDVNGQISAYDPQGSFVDLPFSYNAVIGDLIEFEYSTYHSHANYASSYEYSNQHVGGSIVWFDQQITPLPITLENLNSFGTGGDELGAVPLAIALSDSGPTGSSLDKSGLPSTGLTEGGLGAVAAALAASNGQPTDDVVDDWQYEASAHSLSLSQSATHASSADELFATLSAGRGDWLDPRL